MLSSGNGADLWPPVSRTRIFGESSDPFRFWSFCVLRLNVSHVYVSIRSIRLSLQNILENGNNDSNVVTEEPTRLYWIIIQFQFSHLTRNIIATFCATNQKSKTHTRQITRSCLPFWQEAQQRDSKTPTENTGNQVRTAALVELEFGTETTALVQPGWLEKKVDGGGVWRGGLSREGRKEMGV